jgi:kynurenine formamidase
MKLFLSDTEYIDTKQPLDLSIPLKSGSENLRAWYVDAPRFETVRANGFLGAVNEGGSVNFRNVFFNPHGHGTHTECLGHITPEVFSVNERVTEYLCKALLLSVIPERVYNQDVQEWDEVVKKEQLDTAKFLENDIEALIIRTLPNDQNKKSKNYSSANPPYLDIEIVQLLDQFNIKHLLIDVPSVDRESDGGKLVFHHRFWKVPEAPNHERTITELVFIKDSIEDGVYLLELQLAPFHNDASPSRPVLYKIQEK